METGKSESMMAYNAHREITNTAYGAERNLASERFRMSDSPDWSENKQMSPTEQRLAAMVQALKELEARNAELAEAIKSKDIATMDKHIEYHRQNGNLTDSMARQTVIEVNKQLNSSSQMMEWNIS